MASYWKAEVRSFNQFMKLEVVMFFKSRIYKTHQDHPTEMAFTKNSVDHTLILNHELLLQLFESFPLG